jgi:hypothetical protein
MAASAVTRRAALAAVGALALPPVAVRSALGQPNVRFRAIVVDVSPLRATLGDPTAAWVQQALPGALAQALAGYMASGDRDGAILVARIDYIYLGPSSGGGGRDAIPTQDTITGTLEIKGPRGGVLSNVPVRAISSYFPMAVDQAVVEEAYYWRVVALAQAFAGWAPRELGLS